MIVVWTIAFVLLFTISVMWYVTLPVAFALGSSVESQMATLPAALNMLRLVEYVVILWGPIWDFFIVLWAFMESHRVDVTSQIYG